MQPFAAIVRDPHASRLEVVRSSSHSRIHLRRVARVGMMHASNVSLASSSQNQHCVAIAEEAVTTANCLEISLANQLDSDQGAYQNQQAAAWQVKIGDERVQSAERRVPAG